MKFPNFLSILASFQGEKVEKSEELDKKTLNILRTFLLRKKIQTGEVSRISLKKCRFSHALKKEPWKKEQKTFFS